MDLMPAAIKLYKVEAVYEGANLVSEDTKFVKDITGINEAYEIMNLYCLKQQYLHL
jgi:dethiobiotin synthetase